MRQVANFLWEGTEPVDERRWLAAIDSDQEKLVGQFAFEGVDERGRKVLARDRLGVNKQFFCLEEGTVHWSNFLVDLVSRGVPVERIWSVPSGHSVYIGDRESDYELRKHASLQFAADAPTDVPTLAESIRRGLEITFSMIRKAVGSRRVYVTMSGGLDSTTIAALARTHLPDVTGVTFSLTNPGDEGHSEDSRFAVRVAADLGIPIELIHCNNESMMELLDDTLVYGQDYRDFNVHCGLVNAAIGQELQRRHETITAGNSSTPLVLTGDTMNELMADYTEVSLQGRVYYPLPRMKKGLLRRVLVNGLDSGDREVGIFSHFGLDVIQPYALCAERYTALPAEFLTTDDAKQRLVRLVMGDEIPDYILSRPKVRAQAGDATASQGVLGAFMRAGIDQNALKHRFAQIMGITMKEVDRLIRAGFYRFTETHPGGLP